MLDVASVGSRSSAWSTSTSTKSTVKGPQGSVVVINSTSSTSSLSVGGRWATMTAVTTVEKKVSAAPTPPVRQKLKWRKGACVGTGGFGKVYIGLNEDTGELLAVKEIEFQHLDQKVATRLAALQREIKMMRELKHPNIVRYVCSERVGCSMNIFMEYVPGGSIASLLEHFGKLNEHVVSMYTRDITRALQYLHNHEVVHRDVKAANVLINVKGDVKLADFGAAMFLKEQKGLKGKDITYGTPCWMSPEVITTAEVAFSADIWSLGCTILEMLTGRTPFYHISSSPFAVMRFVGDESREVTLPPDLERTVECEDLLLNCLRRVPSERLTTLGVLKHAFNDRPDPVDWEEDSHSESEPPTSKVLSPEDTVLTDFPVMTPHALNIDGSPDTKYAPTVSEHGESLVMSLDDRKGSRRKLKMLPKSMFNSPGLVRTSSSASGNAVGKQPSSDKVGCSVGTLSPTTSYATDFGRGSTYRTNPVRASKTMPPEHHRIAQCLISSCLSLNGIDFDDDDMETIISGRARTNFNDGSRRVSQQGSPTSTVLPFTSREMSVVSEMTPTPNATKQEIHDCVTQMLARNIAEQPLEQHVVHLDAECPSQSPAFTYKEKVFMICGRAYKRSVVFQVVCVVFLVATILVLFPIVLLEKFK